MKDSFSQKEKSKSNRLNPYVYLSDNQIIFLNKLEQKKQFYLTGGNNMFEYSFSDKENEIINKQKDISENILTKFGEIDKKYTLERVDITKNETPVYEKMNYTAPTADQTLQSAQNSLAEYKNSSIKAIEDDVNLKRLQLDDKSKTLKENAQNEKSELQQVYSSLKENASNDALKRGLARSSIIVNKLEAFDKSMLDNYMKLDEEYKSAFNELDAQKDLLETQKQNALSAFDITYAVKLDAKLSQLNEEIAKKQEEVIKYNNEIAGKEAEFAKAEEERIADIIKQNNDTALDYSEFISKYGPAAVDNAKSKEKYEIALEELSNMDKDTALAEITNNPEYSKQLGSVYYSRLLSSIKSRE